MFAEVIVQPGERGEEKHPCTGKMETSVGDVWSGAALVGRGRLCKEKDLVGPDFCSLVW